MNISWETRVNSFWESADVTKPEKLLDAMRLLIAERPVNDPAALYELASVHDFLGNEQEAVPLYKAALRRGLEDPRYSQAVVQLASSLRNVGEPEAAVELLEELQGDPVIGDASKAFLALALRDCGRHDEALRVALRALARALPLYERSVMAYADELVPNLGRSTN